MLSSLDQPCPTTSWNLFNFLDLANTIAYEPASTSITSCPISSDLPGVPNSSPPTALCSPAFPGNWNVGAATWAGCWRTNDVTIF